jgi:hypothetical protein
VEIDLETVVGVTVINPVVARDPNSALKRAAMANHFTCFIFAEWAELGK